MEWIKVEDDLPREGFEVLLLTDHASWWRGKLSGGYWHVRKHPGNTGSEILSWSEGKVIFWAEVNLPNVEFLT